MFSNGFIYERMHSYFNLFLTIDLDLLSNNLNCIQIYIKMLYIDLLKQDFGLLSMQIFRFK